MKCVICTGTTGSERRQCLTDLVKLVGESGKLRILDPWTITKVSHPGIDEATILNASDEDRLRYFHDSYQEIAGILSNLRQKQEDIVAIVPMHSVFYWRSLFKDAVKDEFIEWLAPDLFVTIIHNMKDVKSNLASDKHRRFPDITFSEILQWRQRETEGTNRWANKYNKEFMVIARDEPIDTLYGVIFTKKKKVYFSYPMSHVSSRQMSMASKLIRKLRSIGYVVFDPGSIDDPKYISELDKQLKAGVGTIHSEQELSQIAKVVGELTVTLDYKLIEQSDMVVVRYPSVEYQKYIVEDDKFAPAIYVPLSTGVVCEMVKGNNTLKKVFAVWLPKVKPSPFFNYQCTRVFMNEKELLEYLQEYEPPSAKS